MKRIGVLVLVPLAIVSTIAVPASADGQQACTTDTTFCTTYSLTVTAPGTATGEKHAAAPADLNVSVSNTSPSHDSDTNTWWSSLSLSVLRGLGNAVYTSSAKLDPGLLIAGTSSDCAPDSGDGYSFSSCTAGYGTLYANVSGTSGLYDGIHPGTFGIERIVNHSDSVPGELDWVAAVEVCVSTPFGCNVSGPQNVTLELSGSLSSGSTGTLTIPATTSYSYGSVNFVGSLDSITALHVLGKSGTLDNGSPAPHGTQTILHLPDQCGVADASLSATDSATPTAATVKVPLSLDVIGCPAAKFKAAETKPYTVSLDAHSSLVGTAGRHLSYQWSINRGHPITTKKPTLTHRFATSKPAVVQLIVVATLGAISKPATLRLNGSKLTIKAPAKARPGAHLRVSGRLTGWPNKPSLAHRTVLLERCRTTTKHCSKVATLHTNGHGVWSRRTTFSRSKPVFVVSFNGGHRDLGTRAHRTVHRRKH